jgi:subtilisin family serine protease
MSNPTVVIARVELDSVRNPIGFLHAALSQFPGSFRIVPMMPGSSKPREDGEAIAPARTTNPLADFFRIELPDKVNPEDVVAHLRGTQGVVTAYVEPEYALPMAASTPVLDSSQLYLGPAPDGIDANYAWTQRATGSGVTMAVIEKGWLLNHEDFDARRIKLHGSMDADAYSVHHGTASVGVTFARRNQFGLTGIASDIDAVHCYSILGTDNSPAAAIVAAVNESLKAGDVLLIELQAAGPKEGSWIPIEYNDAEYAAIEFATMNGITVIAAAGNGETNLDDDAYGGRFNRDLRDSGAILVGAGGAPGSELTRCRLLFSNWGSRVDVQAYGENVATTGFGPLFGRAEGLEQTRWYTNGFSGTSSAAAIVAGACVLIQSFAKQGVSGPLDPRDLRDLLVATGTPQADHPDSPDEKYIGPLPDLQCAIDQLLDRPPRAPRRSAAQAPLVHSGHGSGSHGDSAV